MACPRSPSLQLNQRALFFFSSRRRHTRSVSDWSSDVCSSDLLRQGAITLRQLVDAGRSIGPGKRLGTILVEQGILDPKDLVRVVVDQTQEIIYGAFLWTEGEYRLEIGRASCRERVYISGGAPP